MKRRSLEQIHDDMKALVDAADPELAHGNADDLLEEFIGYLAGQRDPDGDVFKMAQEILRYYHAVPEWHA